mmetsp:Transcript_38084/g.82085  ORF Transcript_38084/g.82085 Transcript_38084/m.82085 type:complete len:201 (-) Transcript_38084:38-640(-)
MVGGLVFASAVSSSSGILRGMVGAAVAIATTGGFLRGMVGVLVSISTVVIATTSGLLVVNTGSCVTVIGSSAVSISTTRGTLGRPLGGIFVSVSIRAISRPPGRPLGGWLVVSVSITRGILGSTISISFVLVFTAISTTRTVLATTVRCISIPISISRILLQTLLDTTSQITANFFTFPPRPFFFVLTTAYLAFVRKAVF